VDEWREEILKRLAGLNLPPAREAEIVEEVAQHLEDRYQELLGCGANEEEARRVALKELSPSADGLARGLRRVEQEVPQEAIVPGAPEKAHILGGIWQDVRYGLRMLRRNPGFAALAILTLALGIGANTAIFSVVNAVLLKPSPYEDPKRLITVWSQNLPKGFTTDLVSAPDFADWRAQCRVFDEMAASTDAMYTLTGQGQPIAVTAYRFSPDFFHVLGVRPLFGRAFLPHEAQPGKNHVVVLSYGFWQSRFGGDPKTVGRTVILDGEPYSVVGVMPESFDYPGNVVLWTPLTIPADLAAQRDARYLRVLARLRPGVSLEQARRELDTIADRLAKEYPKTNTGENTVRLVPLRELEVGGIEPALLALMGAVAFVLLIACANVASLLLARAAARQKEIAIRASLGAGWTRIVRQFLTESALLALLGGAAGLFLAASGTGPLFRMFPPNVTNIPIPRVERIPIDAKVLLFAFAISLLTALVFGLAPAFRAGRLNLCASLKETGRSFAGSAGGSLFRRVLIVGELALSLALLVGAGLMMKSFFHLIHGDLGFNPGHVLTLRALLPEYKYKSPDQQRAFVSQVLGDMRALPGVESAASVTFLPLSGWYGIRNFTIVGRAAQDPAQQSLWSSVTPDYFRTMGIPLLRGRLFNADDRKKSAGAVVISDAMARKFWPHEDTLGQRITLQYLQGPREIVGVVGNVRQFGQGVEAQPEVYLPYDQAPLTLVCFGLRTSQDPTGLASAAQRAVWAADKDQAISYVMSMDELVSETVAPERVTAVLLAIFAGLAVALASVGVYGVIANTVGQRTHEFGVRVSLGATMRDVLALVLKEAVGLILAGLAVGLAAAVGLSRLMSSMLASVHTLDPSTGVNLYGVAPLDPLTYLLVSLLLASVALVASYIPARRATKVDPMVALRDE
jgi:putative ABC transport system permease protein